MADSPPNTSRTTARSFVGSTSKNHNRSGLLKELRAEAELMQRLDHPHVIRTIDAYYVELAGGRPEVWLIEEYAHGGQLFSWCRRRSRPLRDLDHQRLAYELLDGLNYLHTHGVLHRDIKPENLVFASRPDYARSRGKSSSSSSGSSGAPAPAAFRLPLSMLRLSVRTSLQRSARWFACGFRLSPDPTENGYLTHRSRHPCGCDVCACVRLDVPVRPAGRSEIRRGTPLLP